MWVWVLADLVNPGHWEPQGKGESQLFYNHAIGASSPMPRLRNGIISYECGAISSIALASEGQDQLSQNQQSADLIMPLRFQYTWFLWPLMVKWAMEINIDPSCIRIMNPDMALRAFRAQTSPWLW